MACIDVAAEQSDFNCDDVGKASMCLPRLYDAERFQADGFRRRSKWRHEFALCEAAQGEFAYCKCDQECKMLASVN